MKVVDKIESLNDGQFQVNILQEVVLYKDGVLILYAIRGLV
jgi:hypothetical protein